MVPSQHFVLGLVRRSSSDGGVLVVLVQILPDRGHHGVASLAVRVGILLFYDGGAVDCRPGLVRGGVVEEEVDAAVRHEVIHVVIATGGDLDGAFAARPLLCSDLFRLGDNRRRRRRRRLSWLLGRGRGRRRRLTAARGRFGGWEVVLLPQDHVRRGLWC